MTNSSDIFSYIFPHGSLNPPSDITILYNWYLLLTIQQTMGTLKHLWMAIYIYGVLPNITSMFWDRIWWMIIIVVKKNITFMAAPQQCPGVNQELFSHQQPLTRRTFRKCLLVVGQSLLFGFTEHVAFRNKQNHECRHVDFPLVRSLDFVKLVRPTHLTRYALNILE